MLSPAQRGAVCAVRHHPHPISIARKVMEHRMRMTSRTRICFRRGCCCRRAPSGRGRTG
jgi:hypothetical protein